MPVEGCATVRDDDPTIKHLVFSAEPTTTGPSRSLLGDNITVQLDIICSLNSNSVGKLIILIFPPCSQLCRIHVQSYINKSSSARHDFHNNAGILIKPETGLFLLLLGYIISYNTASFPVTNISICYQNMVLKIYSRILFYIKIICF